AQVGDEGGQQAVPVRVAGPQEDRGRGTVRHAAGGEVLRRQGQVDAGADDAGPPAVHGDDPGEAPADLPACDEDVVGPLELGGDPGLGEGGADGQPGDDGQPAQRVRGRPRGDANGQGDGECL